MQVIGETKVPLLRHLSSLLIPMFTLLTSAKTTAGAHLATPWCTPTTAWTGPSSALCFGTPSLMSGKAMAAAHCAFTATSTSTPTVSLSRPLVCCLCPSYTKYVKKLISIHAAGENCVLATQAEDVPGQYVLILCNAIGSPVDSKYIDIEPKHIAMTEHHVVAANDDTLYVWQYRTSVSKLTSVGAVSGLARCA